MTRKFHGMLVAGLSIAMTLVLGGPAQAQAARQKDKNNMRNLAIGLGALAAQQGATGKTANALILGAGAAYAGKKYEDARKAQGREESWRDRYEDDRRYDGDYRRDDDRYNDGLRERQRVRYDRQDNGKKLGHYKNGKLQKGENCR